MCIDSELLEVSYISGFEQDSESLDYMYPYTQTTDGPHMIVPISGSKLLYYSCGNYDFTTKGSEMTSIVTKTWIFSPCPLVTINNLPQTVIKTTAETMKVTYTVTYE